MRETERKDKEVCGLFSTPQLSPPWHPRDQVAWLSCQNSEVFLQQQGKICTWKENPVLPLPPSLGWRKQGVCCRLGVCALAAHPSPSPTFHSQPPSRWDTTAKPFPCLTASSWHTKCTAIWWGSKPPPRVLLTLDSGKSSWASAFPYFFSSSLYMPFAIRLWKRSTSWDIGGLWITSESDLKTIMSVILLKQNQANEQNCVLEPGTWYRKS